MPDVSIILPCRNEETYIGRCLSSIIDNDYPKKNLEVIIVDGMSDDATGDIAREYSSKYSFIKVLKNTKKITPAALNIGIKNAKGEIIMRMDTHCTYEKKYISKCVTHLQNNDADNVGGICVTLPGSESLVAKTIAIALSHPFGVGNSYFRIGSKAPRYVDTVPFGCYRKDVFSKIGLFDEDMLRNQDDEFNFRLTKNGGKILLVPDIVTCYYARDSLLKLWKMYYQYGYFKPLVAQKVGGVLTWRQLMPAVFVGVLFVTGILSLIMHSFLWVFLLVIFLYGTADFVVSFALGMKKGFRFVLTLPFAFVVLHLSYGTGYLKGIWDFILMKKCRMKKLEDISLSR